MGEVTRLDDGRYVIVAVVFVNTCFVGGIIGSVIVGDYGVLLS